MIGKLKSKSGLTLMEMMAALLVMVLLVVGMGTGMDAGMRVYRDSQFETDSAALADILNTSLGDIFRYADNIKSKDELSETEQAKLPQDIQLVFTNSEFGVLDGYFVISEDTVCLKNLHDNDKTTNLVTAGAYPDLKINKFYITYAGRNSNRLEHKDNEGNILKEADVARGGFFYITYDIISKIDSEKIHSVETVVRQMNAG